jgi:hypothetical protein
MIIHKRIIEIKMTRKKAFALRINEDILKAVEKWASDEFRSTNGQLEWMLNKCLKDAHRDPGRSKNSN